MMWDVKDNITDAPVPHAILTCIKQSTSDEQNEEAMFVDQCRKMFYARCITRQTCKRNDLEPCISTCENDTQKYDRGCSQNIFYNV